MSTKTSAAAGSATAAPSVSQLSLSPIVRIPTMLVHSGALGRACGQHGERHEQYRRGSDRGNKPSHVPTLARSQTSGMSGSVAGLDQLPSRAGIAQNWPSGTVTALTVPYRTPCGTVTEI